MTATQLALDACEPTWADPEPDDEDDGPYCGTVTALRAAEIHDQRGQGVAPAALWTAHTVPTGSYL